MMCHSARGKKAFDGKGHTSWPVCLFQSIQRRTFYPGSFDEKLESESSLRIDKGGLAV